MSFGRDAQDSDILEGLEKLKPGQVDWVKLFELPVIFHATVWVKLNDFMDIEKHNKRYNEFHQMIHHVLSDPIKPREQLSSMPKEYKLPLLFYMLPQQLDRIIDSLLEIV